MKYMLWTGTQLVPIGGVPAGPGPDPEDPKVPPPAVISLAGSSPSATQVHASWLAPADPNVDGSISYYQVDLNGTDYNWHWTSTSITIGDLDPDAEYTVTVRAVNDSGLVGPSSSVTVWTQVEVPPVDDPISTTMQSSVTQNNITISFSVPHPVGYYVSGDPFVVGSPIVTQITPGWDGQRHGATVNPAVEDFGWHTALSYTPSANFAAQLPRALTPGDSLVATWGWLESDSEVQQLGITITANPAAPRPAVRNTMILTSVATAPQVGSFRPPYVDGPKWEINEGDLNTDLLANLDPLGDYPSWSSVEDSIGQPWAPDCGYGSRHSRYHHPYQHMPDYGRDMASAMYQACLMLNTDAPLETKRFTLRRVVQYGIDVLAITRKAHEVQFRTSGAQTHPGWWADFGGGHGVGRDLPALMVKNMLGNPTYLQEIWDLGPRWWGDMGQIWVSNGNSSQDPWRSEGEATWGEGPHTRPNSRRPGTVSYRTCCTGRTQGAGVLAALAMGIAGEWNHPDAPFIEYIDWYVDTDQAGQGTSRFIRDWYAPMWDTYRQNYTY